MQGYQHYVRKHPLLSQDRRTEGLPPVPPLTIFPIMARPRLRRVRTREGPNWGKKQRPRAVDIKTMGCGGASSFNLSSDPSALHPRSRRLRQYLYSHHLLDPQCRRRKGVQRRLHRRRRPTTARMSCPSRSRPWRPTPLRTVNGQHLATNVPYLATNSQHLPSIPRPCTRC